MDYGIGFELVVQLVIVGKILMGWCDVGVGVQQFFINFLVVWWLWVDEDVVESYVWY